MRWPEVTARLALVVGLAAAIAGGAAVWLTAPLGLLAIAVTAEVAVRPYAASPVDRLLLSCGATVTVLILVGLVLNLTTWGLTKVTWTAAWLVMSIAVLVWRRNLRTRLAWPAAWSKSLTPWMVLASLVLIFAAVVALAGVRRWDHRPALAFSIVSQTTDAIVVEIEASSTSGTYQIVATPKNQEDRQYTSAVLTIKAGGGGLQLQERVPVSTPGTWMIGLKSMASGTIVRSVRVNLS